MEKKSDKRMQTNQLFSFQRLMLLGKQSFIINKKLIGISLAGFAGVLFMLLLLFQSKSNFSNWGNKEYMITFTFLFFTLGVIYSSLSFPAFRSKEKSITYLLLPATASEKFTFEILTRIVVFLLLMPLLYWVVANLAGAIVNYYVPQFTTYQFSFNQAFSAMADQGMFKGWAKLLFAQGVLFVFIASFAGASHFSKSPLLKTMFTISLIVAGYALFTYLLVKGLNLQAYHPANDRIVFVDSKNDAIAFFAILSTLINLCLLAIAWFCLKEKEA